MERLIQAAHALHIPITVGSAGTCGSDLGVDELAACLLYTSRCV